MLRDNLNGFRDRRSTTSHILTLRRVLEEAKNKSWLQFWVNIDFKKAFDSVYIGRIVSQRKLLIELKSSTLTLKLRC